MSDTTTPDASLSGPSNWTPQVSVLFEIKKERIRQDDKWGVQNCHDFEWCSILTEEVGEVARAANEANFDSGKNRGDFRSLRAELIQVAAVAAAWVEAIDRRSLTEESTTPPPKSEPPVVDLMAALEASFRKEAK
jgi:NTP pyrophosphatase (non-canonical NTP hydrolase)